MHNAFQKCLPSSILFYIAKCKTYAQYKHRLNQKDVLDLSVLCFAAVDMNCE